MISLAQAIVFGFERVICSERMCVMVCRADSLHMVSEEWASDVVEHQLLLLVSIDRKFILFYSLFTASSMQQQSDWVWGQNRDRHFVRSKTVIVIASIRRGQGEIIHRGTSKYTLAYTGSCFSTDHYRRRPKSIIEQLLESIKRAFSFGLH